MSPADTNRIVRRVYQIATTAAMNGRPLDGIQWVPPASTSSSPDGTFVVFPHTPRSGSQRGPWEG